MMLSRIGDEGLFFARELGEQLVRVARNAV